MSVRKNTRALRQIEAAVENLQRARIGIMTASVEFSAAGGVFKDVTDDAQSQVLSVERMLTNLAADVKQDIVREQEVLNLDKPPKSNVKK